MGVPKKHACVYTPPEGQDITIYLVRLQSILDQLNIQHDKIRTQDRLKLLIDDITRVLDAAKK
jgi:hypothetical protein